MERTAARATVSASTAQLTESVRSSPSHPRRAQLLMPSTRVTGSPTRSARHEPRQLHTSKQQSSKRSDHARPLQQLRLYEYSHFIFGHLHTQEKAWEFPLDRLVPLANSARSPEPATATNLSGAVQRVARFRSPYPCTGCSKCSRSVSSGSD